MKKIYHLPNCGTCKKILEQLNVDDSVLVRDIKTQAITAEEVDEMAILAGSYEALFSRVAMKYRSMGLDKMTLSEKDYKSYIMQEYTFLKRPTVIVGNRIFVGSSKNNVESLKKAFNESV